MKLEIMDTTLRDGEQTSGVAFTESEKLNIASMLLKEVNVDRIEVGSARVSEGEFKAVQRIASWAKENNLLDRIEVLGFVDNNKSVDWINEAGAKVLNLLCKGSLKHLKGQLKKEPSEHVKDIKKVIEYANKLGISVNIYLEDWSNGIKNSEDYVYYLVESLKNEPIKRFMLPDTLGILTPYETYEYIKKMKDRYPELFFDFHGHNDYELGVANTLFAVKAGCNGVHTTVNGLGERAGNVTLSSVVAVLNDHLKLNLAINEKALYKISKLVEAFSGIRIPKNKPIIGENVFTQTCGVHADGDRKAMLYYNDLVPERFGRVRKYALGKTSGKASIAQNLEQLGIELSKEDMEKVTQRVIELGDKKEYITPEDLPYIISDVLGSEVIKENIKLKNFYVCNANGLKPVATILLEVNGESYQETETGDGQYDAFMKAVKKIYSKLKKPLPNLIDYTVSIPPGGKTEALVETIITWELDGKEFNTRGLDSDQTVAAIKATINMLNLIEMKKL